MVDITFTSTAQSSSPTVSASSPLRHIIIIRGPAGAGKSTVSACILDALRGAGVPTCYLEQDVFRNTMLKGGPRSAAVSAAMLQGAADASLNGGYSVVLEGILNSSSTRGGQYRSLIESMVERHDDHTRVSLFYLNPSLEATKTRHLGRAKASSFGVDKLDKWWKSSAPTGIEGEVVIDTSLQSVEQTVQTVREHVGV
ncbi:hypothetical protein KIPB_009943, partial [Kipferlia bialata]|eukprot:g9943.t1